MKKYRNKLISLALQKRKGAIEGVVVDYNADWTLLCYNPVDYVVDGYILVHNKKVTGFQRSREEIFKEKIIRLKGYDQHKNKVIQISGLETMVPALNTEYDLVQLELKSEKLAYIGRLKFMGDQLLRLDTITPKGKRGNVMYIQTSDIRTIQFDNDYTNSLKLFLKQK